MTRQIIFDTETTGLSPKEGHKIIEIGCVELVNRKLTGNNFHYYLNPHRELDPESIKIHGLTREFLSNKPSFQHIVHDFLRYIADAELIAHNASFDVSFLDYELSLLEQNLGKLIKINDCAKVTDTLVMAKQLHPGQRNSLDALCKRYNVDNSERELHGALLDSHLLAKVYLAMTGGQGSFDFFESYDDTKINGRILNKVNYQKVAVTENLNNKELLANYHKKNNDEYLVIKANDAELQEHHNVLQLIKKRSEDGCLWLDLTKE
jgi:DNA polymerase-3 subunit epsilon